MLYTLLQGFDWEYLASTPTTLSSSGGSRRSISRPSSTEPATGDILQVSPTSNAKRRFSLGIPCPESTPLPFFDPLVQPQQLWGAIEDEVREEMSTCPEFNVSKAQATAHSSRLRPVLKYLMKCIHRRGPL